VGEQVIDALVTVLVMTSLALAAWAGLLALLNRRPGLPYLGALAIVEVILLAQVVIAAVRLISGDRPDEVVTFLGYLVAAPLILPLGALWALSERTRWSTLVLAAADLGLAVVAWRLQTVWRGTGG
jgi:hypothetical protein